MTLTMSLREPHPAFLMLAFLFAWTQSTAPGEGGGIGCSQDRRDRSDQGRRRRLYQSR
jgi:hypothetical protein